MDQDNSDNPDGLPLSDVLQQVAEKLDTLAKHLRKSGRAEALQQDSKLIKEILLSTLASMGRDELSDEYVERIVATILKNRQQ